MSVEHLKQSMLNLSPRERRRFLEWLDKHKDKLIETGVSIRPKFQAEVLRRREEALAHPEKLRAWESAFPEMKDRFEILRRRRDSA